MEQLSALWEESGLKPQDLVFIGVGVGPGSYTGVRVGAVIAKMLTLSWKVPLVEVSSLAAYASSTSQPFYAAFDGRISGAYLSLNGTGEPQAVPLDEIPAGAHLVSPHTSLQRRLSGLPLSFELASVSLDPFASVALKRFNAGQTTEGALNILYLRKTQAELNLA
jgi:tRNA threonylcarbamoyladenosine biosynthesis protein TsaB